MNIRLKSVLLVLALYYAGNVSAAETGLPGQIDFETEVAFEQALEERENGDLNRAIQALKAILDDYPQFHRARLALAVAYYQGMQYARARSEADMVMQDPATSEETQQQIRSFLSSLNKADTRQSWTPSILIGLIADSNANVAPNDTEFTLPGGGSLVLPSDAVSTSDVGMMLQASISHRYLAPETRRIGGQEAAFVWQSRADLFSTNYAEETDQNIQLLKLETGPAQFFGRDMQARLRGVVSQLWLGGESYLSILGLRPAVSFNSRRTGLKMTIDAEYQNRDYQQTMDNARDSDYRAARLKFDYSLPQGNARVAASIQGFAEDTQVDYYSRTGRSYTLDFINDLSRYTRILAHAEWSWSDYMGPDPFYGLSRNDKIIRWSLGTEHTFSDSALKHWTMMVSLNHSRNITNIASYSYQRNQALFALRRSF